MEENGSPPAAKRLRNSIEQQVFAEQEPKASSPLSLELQTSSKRRWLCNELVFELSANIPAVRTSDDILLTAVNVYTYLAERFRKIKQVPIYRDVIAFIKAKLNKKKGKGIRIVIDQVFRNNPKGIAMVSQRELTSRFELVTNQLRIRVFSWAFNHKRECHINANGEGYDNEYLFYFIRLIVPLIKPVKLQLNHNCAEPSRALFLKKLYNCFDWIQLRAVQSISEQICAALANYNKMQIVHYPHKDIGLNVWPHFCRALVQWLTANEQTKQCFFEIYFSCEQKLTILLEEVIADFSRATVNSQFVVHFSRLNDAVRPLREFSLDNGAGEVLELRESANAKHSPKTKYTLVRRPVGKWDLKKYMESDFDDNEEIAEIQLA